MTGTLTLELDDQTITLDGEVTSMGFYQGSPLQQINLYNEKSGKTAQVILGETKWNDLEPCWNKELNPQPAAQGVQGKEHSKE